MLFTPRPVPAAMTAIADAPWGGDAAVPGGAARDEAWRRRLKEELRREAIPAYLAELQRLVASLRRWRDDLKVPAADEVRPLLTPALRRHPGLTLAYLDDARYRDVVEQALRGEGTLDASP